MSAGENNQNKRKSIIKRLTIFSSMIPLLFVLSSSSIKKNKEYLDGEFKISKGKIEYTNGIIYIGNEKYLKSIEELNKYDVLALDNRKATDPNIKIYDSYRIVDPDIREEIIDGLLMYEKEYPTKWFRTRNSLIREWTLHNLMYQVGYNLDSTTDVDLNNEDEKTYRINKLK